MKAHVVEYLNLSYSAGLVTASLVSPNDRGLVKVCCSTCYRVVINHCP